MPSYKLTYFDFAGRGEISRVLFSIAGQDFVDHRIQFSEWPAIKPTTPFGQIPVLEITSDDGTKTELCQSLAIARFLAREFHLSGSTSLEQAQSDMLLEQLNDLLNAYAPIMFEQDAEAKKVKEAKFFNETVPALLSKLDQRLEKTKFFLGDNFSVADLYVMVLFDILKEKGSEPEEKIVANFPKFSNLLATLRSQPAVVSYNKKYNSK